MVNDMSESITFDSSLHADSKYVIGFVLGCLEVPQTIHFCFRHLGKKVRRLDSVSLLSSVSVEILYQNFDLGLWRRGNRRKRRTIQFISLLALKLNFFQAKTFSFFMYERVHTQQIYGYHWNEKIKHFIVIILANSCLKFFEQLFLLMIKWEQRLYKSIIEKRKFSSLF